MSTACVHLGRLERLPAYDDVLAVRGNVAESPISQGGGSDLQTFQTLSSHPDSKIFLLTLSNWTCIIPDTVTMVKTEGSLLSPLSESTSTVPLDSPIRTTPIHPDLPEIQVPGVPLP